MIDILIVGELAALASHAKNHSFESKIERLQADVKSGKLSPQEAQNQYRSLINSEVDKIPAAGIPLPPNIKQALKSGIDYKELAGKVDPDTYNFFSPSLLVWGLESCTTQVIQLTRIAKLQIDIVAMQIFVNDLH